MLLEYTTRQGLLGAGHCVVTEGGRQVAEVKRTARGLFVQAVTWTWATPVAPEWQMSCDRGDRFFSVHRTDGAPVGTIARGRSSSAFTMTACDGAQAFVEGRSAFASERSVLLPGGGATTLIRSSPTVTFTNVRRWQIDIPDGLGSAVSTLLTALPLVADHRRRRQEGNG